MATPVLTGADLVGCGKTQLSHTLCITAQVWCDTLVRSLANMHSFQEYLEPRRENCRKLTWQDMGGAEGKVAFIGNV